MVLKDDYQEIKENEEYDEQPRPGLKMGMILGNLIILGVYIGIINILWNLLCPIFSLSPITYVQTVGLLMFIIIIKLFFAILVVRKNQ